MCLTAFHCFAPVLHHPQSARRAAPACVACLVLDAELLLHVDPGALDSADVERKPFSKPSSQSRLRQEALGRPPIIPYLASTVVTSFCQLSDLTFVVLRPLFRDSR